MKKDIPAPVVLCLVAALIAGFILSHIFIKGAKAGVSVTAPIVPSSFPDVKNDSQYNFFLNESALDPTQVAPVGNSQNTAPFSGGQ